MESNYNAKDLFLEYAGSHYQMERDGVYKTYLSFNISKEIEEKWALECQEKWLSSFQRKKIVDNDAINLFQSIIQFKKTEVLILALNFIEEQVDCFDDFSRILLAEHLFLLLESGRFALGICSRLLNTLSRVVAAINVKSISVSEFYKGIGYLNDSLREDRLLIRVEKIRKKLEAVS
jgi:hypothetical protein